MWRFHAPFGFLGTDGGAGGGGDGGSGDGGAGDKGGSGGGSDKTFTQADVDRIVTDRLNRQKGQFSDYDDLKKKAAQFDELDGKNKTDLEKANAKIADLEKGNTDRDQTITELRLRGAVSSAATKLKFHDPEDALKLLDVSSVEFDKDSGEPKNLEALLDALAKSKPHLVAAGSAGSADGGARGSNGGTDPTDYSEHVKKLPKF